MGRLRPVHRQEEVIWAYVALKCVLGIPVKVAQIDFGEKLIEHNCERAAAGVREWHRV